MKTHVTRRIPLAAAVCLALAMLALGFPASAEPVKPNPGHEWSEIGLPPGTWPGLDADTVDGLHATDFWRLNGNSGTSPGTNFLGTTDDKALELKVGNERALRLEPNATSPNVIGGYSGNSVATGVVGATISGGGLTADPNSVTADYATVGGGRSNTASAYATTVGGGYDNIASGTEATIAGGCNNRASTHATTVGGGDGNIASGAYAATVGGGISNVASEGYATVGGGLSNDATAYAATVGGGIYNDAEGGGATVGGGDTNRVTDGAGTVGGGKNNQAGNANADPEDATYATVGGGSGNTASGLHATVGGGVVNTASFQAATVGGGTTNTASKIGATVGGGASNSASASYATVGGGGGNVASVDWSTVGGGQENLADGHDTTVGGGRLNTASEAYATVGGGYNNSASGLDATVGGGQSNSASGQFATVGGGIDNTASGGFAMVPAGVSNTAQGDYSLAAGRLAKANHDGALVWADNSVFDFASTANNEFSARATGGVRFVLGIDGSGNATWTCSVVNGGTWSCTSSSALKENLVAADGRDILERLSDVSVFTWNAKGQDSSVRHIGPMAEDFYAAFGVGEDDGRLATIDLDGVALAAIQGLYELVQEKDAEIAALEERLEDVEQGVGGSTDASQSSSSGLPATWLLLSALVLGALAAGLSGLVLVQRRLAGGR